MGSKLSHTMFSHLVKTIYVFIPLRFISLAFPRVESFVDVTLLVHVIDYLNRIRTYLREFLFLNLVHNLWLNLHGEISAVRRIV